MKRSREPEESPCASTGGDSPVPDAPSPKIRELDGEGDQDGASFRCTWHARPMTFCTSDEYEAHYRKQHQLRCNDCRKNFPSNHLLGVHIEECHDAFVAARRDKGEHTYSCFVEGCDRKCRDPSKRRRHLIDKHMYPQSFYFDVVRYGIDGKQSLLVDAPMRPKPRDKAARSYSKEATPGSLVAPRIHPKGASGEASRGQAGVDVEPPNAEDTSSAQAVKDVEMNDANSLAGSLSSLKLVPRSITFGRDRRGGFARSSSVTPNQK